MADAPFVEVYTGDIADDAQRVFLSAPFIELVQLFPPDPPAPVAPVVSNVTPAAGTAITATQPIGFDVTDDSGLFRRIMVIADFGLLKIREVIHDGDNFGPRYTSVVGNTRSIITDGFHYNVLREGGWPGSPTITAYAIDQEGAENT